MQIIEAKKEHLKEICELIRNSIKHLCYEDHLNKKHHLNNWLSERSEQNLATLLFDKNSQAFICINNESIIGVSHIKNTGELTLCYVHPLYTGKGIGSLLLQAVEKQALEWDLDEVKMISTTTAKYFYLAKGYQQYDKPITCIGMTGYPLKKNLAQTGN